MTTYSISLHDVDLALLPLRTHEYNDFLKKEYFEFQVTKNDNIVEDTEPTILYTCHICAIEVPAAFACEHATSFKHRANARIASVAAERTRALITALPPPAAARPTARFCANCATIVDEDHEKTKKHQGAVMHDKLLWDLMKAYVQEDCDEHKYEHSFTDSDNQRNGNNNTGKVNNHKKDYIDLKNGDGSDKNSKNIIPKPLKQKKLIQNGEHIANNCETNGELKKQKKDLECKAETSQCDDRTKTINDTTEYIQSINQPVLVTPSVWGNIPKDMTENESKVSKPIGPKKPVINGIENDVNHDEDNYGELLRKLIVNKDSFEFQENAILTRIKINDNILSIYSDNFHSYDRIHYRGKLKCIVCDCMLDIEDAEDHKYDSKHMHKIINLGNNDHHVREIDESYSHCIVCNLKIKTAEVDMHKQLPLHTVRKHIYTSNIDKTTTGSTTATNNVIQYGDIDKNLEGTPAINEKHKEETVVRKETSNKVGSGIEYPYELIDTKNVRCVVCKRQVPNDVRNREVHIKGSKHRNAEANMSFELWAMLQ